MYFIFTKKIWLKKNFDYLKNKKIIIRNKLSIKEIYRLKPKFLFFIHWSKYIPPKIFKNFLCIQFHTSDLPFGRGGSPVQNLILMGKKKTKITAFKVESEVDSGPYCMKRKINLNGNAENIFRNIEKISINMINSMVNMSSIKFKKQRGKITYFKRRRKNESEFNKNKKKLNSLIKINDFIRALDAEGYPKANLTFKNFKILLSNSKIYKNKLIGKFEIEKKK